MPNVSNSNAQVDAATDRFTETSNQNQMKQLSIATQQSNTAVTTALADAHVKTQNKLGDLASGVKL